MKTNAWSLHHPDSDACKTFAKSFCKSFGTPRVISRTDIAFMVQEIVSEAHSRPKDTNMIDLVYKYYKKLTGK